MIDNYIIKSELHNNKNTQKYKYQRMNRVGAVKCGGNYTYHSL